MTTRRARKETAVDDRLRTGMLRSNAVSSAWRLNYIANFYAVPFYLALDHCIGITRSEYVILFCVAQNPGTTAQQIVAATASEECDEDQLFDLVRRAAPYATLARADFDAVVDMLSDGIATSRGRSGALVHRDAVNRRLRGRRGGSGRRGLGMRHGSGSGQDGREQDRDEQSPCAGTPHGSNSA